LGIPSTYPRIRQATTAQKRASHVSIAGGREKNMKGKKRARRIARAAIGGLHVSGDLLRSL